jgi:hypothetical protein
MAPELDAAVSAAGVVGTRQLVLVQTIDIARLTTHPVPIIPGTFVAVGGRGPKGDSNESGKTSFLAAVGLLLGDSEWRTSSQGGAGAAAILFEPETAGVSAQQWAAATHGYVIGLFADPQDVVGTALSVWLRISATKPYLTFRWREGVVLPEQATRRIAVDDVFQSLGSRSEVGATTYVATLYGDLPRCLAYVSRRGVVKARPSLLQMNAGVFTPQQIADDLIALTGRSNIYEQEHVLRRDLYAAQQSIAAQEQENQRITVWEDSQLEAVSARQRARAHVKLGKERWRLHFAAGLLELEGLCRDAETALNEAGTAVQEATDDARDADAALAALADREALVSTLSRAGAAHGELATALKTLAAQETAARTRASLHRDEMDALRPTAQAWIGGTAALAAVAANDAAGKLSKASAEHAAAVAEHAAATARLEEARAGHSPMTTRTLARLEEAGVLGMGLLHGLDLAADAREEWEPRLHLFESAVAVAPASLVDALQAVAGLPGAVLVGKDVDGALPAGIDRAPTGSTALLHALATGVGTDEVGALHEYTGLHVVGGFPEARTGAEARIAAAERDVAASAEAMGAVERTYKLAEITSERAKAQWEQASAHERIVHLAELVRREEEDIAASFLAQQAEMAEPIATAFTTLVRANSALDTRDQQMARLKATLTAAQARSTVAQEAVATAERTCADLGRRRDWWEGGWGGTHEAAELALAGRNLDPRTLGNDASEELNRALREVGAGVVSDELLDPKIAEAVRKRSAVSGSDDRERVQFPTVLVPLEEWLDGLDDQDADVEARIHRAREQRSAQLNVASRSCEQLASQLESMQDAVEERIHRALTEIATEYDRLDREVGGYGATIDIACDRPTSPTATWVWRATPKWRRSASRPHLPYDHQTNSAQEKQQTVQLVLAALLASPSATGRVLLLDELGDSLGVEHRRQVLQTIAQSAMTRGFTVLATCQDAVLPDAIKFCGEVLYFEYRSKTEAKNRPTRVIGFDRDRNRVLLTKDHILRDRPPV